MQMENRNDVLYEQMLAGRMQNLKTDQMKTYEIPPDDTLNPVYASIIQSKSPVTIVETKPGVNDVSVIRDRIKALIRAGETEENIIVLDNNRNKFEALQLEYPHLKIRSEYEFISDLFYANYPGYEESNDDLIAATLLVNGYIASDTAKKFTNILLAKNQQNRNFLLAGYINQNKDLVIDMLSEIRQTSPKLSELICQNTTYSMPNLPYKMNAVIINNVTNISVSALCTMIGYANRLHSNLFMVGCPEKSIYDFTGAWDKAIAYMKTQNNSVFHIILRAPESANKNIQAVMEKRPINKNDRDVTTKIYRMQNPAEKENTIREIVKDTHAWIKQRIDAKKSVLIITRTNNEISKIKEEMKAYIPNLDIADITTYFERYMPQIPQNLWKDLAADCENPTRLTIQNFFAALYRPLMETINENTAKMQDHALIMEQSKARLIQFANNIGTLFGGMNAQATVREICNAMIRQQMNEIHTLNEKMKQINHDRRKRANEQVAISTVHSSLGTRYDAVLFVMTLEPDGLTGTLRNSAFSCAKSELNMCLMDMLTNASSFKAYAQTLV